MGGGTYNLSYRATRSADKGYFTKSTDQLFTQNVERNAHPDMSPYGVIRESRDSDEHPESLAFILGLDVTGSMSHIPRDFIKDGLPTMMGTMYQYGVPHPQLMFLAIGDHECDRFPLQVGQFETSDELMDNWLLKTYLEGNGGGNGGESYGLAWKFAAEQTSIDCFEKRGEKGFLFTIGDEPNLLSYPANKMKSLLGGQHSDESDIDLLAKASIKYHIFHIHVNHGSRTVSSRWKETMGERLLIVNNYQDIPKLIADTTVSVMEQNKKLSSSKSKVENIATPAKKEETSAAAKPKPSQDIIF